MRHVRSILIGTLVLSGGAVLAAAPAMAATAIEYGAVPATNYHPVSTAAPAVIWHGATPAIKYQQATPAIKYQG